MKKLSDTTLYLMVWGILGLFILSGCSDERKTKAELEDLYGRAVTINLSEMECRHSAVDTIPVDDNLKAKFTFVNFVDTTQCSPCTLNKMYQWNKYIEKLRKKGVKFVFIFEPSKALLEDVYLSIESSGLKNPIYVDTSYVFSKDNDFIPQDAKYHSFLLDDEGQIIIVGNPLLNQKVEKLIDKTI